MIVLIVLAFILLSISIDAIVKFVRNTKIKSQVVSENKVKVFNVAGLTIPSGIYFDKTHTWAFMEKSGIVKIGIDDFLYHTTGPISRIKMKQPGEQIRKGEPALVLIQNGKQLTINSPVSGTIKFKNMNLLEESSLSNYSPVHEGWIYAIEPSNWLRESQFLFMAEKYKEWLKDEFTRLKDFIAFNKQTRNNEFAHLILQDGGELTDNVLAEFGPDVWEEFQIKFINTSK